MMTTGNAEPHIMWLLLALCAIPLSTRAETVGDFLAQVKGASQDIKCYVCSSADEGSIDDCGSIEKGSNENLIKTCNDVASENLSYLMTVYGAKNLDESLDLNKWPVSLMELAKSSPGMKPGWVYSKGFPSAYLNNGEQDNGTGNSTATPAPPPPAGNGSESGGSGSSLQVSGLAIARQNKETDGLFTKGFQSCRTIKVWADSQKNGGSAREIGYTSPRVVRTCSLLPHDKTGDNFKDGCRTYNFKTGSMEVCYCKGGSTACNKSARFQLSSVGFLVASLLVLISAQMQMGILIKQ